MAPAGILLWRISDQYFSVLAWKYCIIVIECSDAFNDVPNFFRFFKKRYNYTPKDYANAIKMDVK